MALMDFIKKQFIDVIDWVEPSDDVLAWRYPMQDREIQNGAVLTVRESQMAVFLNEGTVADVFGPGRYTLNTRTLPLLTNLRHWDKLFDSPFKSDVYFFSTRQQLNQPWGTAQPVSLRDPEFGAVRLRAFGNHAYRVADAHRFLTEVCGTRERCTAADLEGQLRALLLQHLPDAVAASSVPFLDLSAHQAALAQALQRAVAPAFTKLGLHLDAVTVQSVSLPEELQKVLDQKIGLGMVGDDMGRLMQYQTAQALGALANPQAPAVGGSAAGDAMAMGAGMAMGQAMAQSLQHGLQARQPGAAGTRPEEVMAVLERLAELKAKGVLTDEEFSRKKAELLQQLT